MRQIAAILSAFLCTLTYADVVHVTYQTSVNDTVSTIAETTLETGCEYSTVPAPTKGGYIFTHWSSSESDPLVVRDVWGRSLDSARFTLYQAVVLIAHYVPSSLDSDNDGIPDGWEYYWYGNLNQNAESDTDGDGYTFAQELANGTNPLFPNATEVGGIGCILSETFLYNPHNYAPVIMRSDPEGQFFTSTTNYCAAGDLQRSPLLSVNNGFTVWTVNGIEQRDAFGRALDQVVVEPNTSEIIEVVAHYVADTATRQSLYWYGNTTTAMDSDTDGDGYTFAEEIANGTNPLFPNTTEAGGVGRSHSETFLYNPHNYAPYVVRSEPEGVLFATTTNYVAAGDIQRTDSLQIAKGFAYWTIDGVEQRDAFGRALDQAVVVPDSTRILDVVAYVVTDEVTRQSLYWYGRDDVAMDSDTDGDGYTFAEEIANGTNPLFPDTREPGGVSWMDSETLEANLQPFDAATGAVVDEQFDELFTSPFAGNAATSATFGANTRPVIVDVDGDGNFDLVVLYDEGYAIYLNKGTSDNPMFTRAEGVSTNGLDLTQGSLTALTGLTLDAQPTDAVSCAFGDVDKDGVVDLLVSDVKGRIWYYKGMGEDTYALQHKVWGGSHAGFAQGLTIALVDWDGDGDLDCVCGTADGKLMLLVDPQIGRPTNVQAIAGVDSVVLTWDPNGNSRVRGYGIYRGTDTSDYDCIESLCPLPRYRDMPEVVQDYYYRITSLSRFYIAGNSTPTVYESMPTDAIYVQFRPSVWLNDTSGYTGSDVTVIVSVNNSMGISAEELSMTFTYDPEVLEPRGIRTTGLTESLVSSVSVGSGTETFTSQGGEIATGAGRFLLLDFKIKSVHDITSTTVSLTQASLKALDGRSISLDLPQTATIKINDSRPPVPAGVVLNVSEVYTDTLSEFTVQIPVTSTKVLTNLTFTLGWDSNLLEFRSAAGGATVVGEPSANAATINVKGTIPSVLYLTFYAKDQHSATKTTMTISNASAYCVDGLAAKMTLVDGTVYLTDANVPEPVELLVKLGNAKAQSGQTFPVIIAARTSGGDLASMTLEVEWDSSLLTFNDAPSAQTVETLASNKRKFVFACSGNYNQFSLNFTASTITALQVKSWLKLHAASGVGKNGLDAVLNPELVLPRTETILIVREVGKYDPGDVDGDGAYTNNDLLILNGYIIYKNRSKQNAVIANVFANGYKSQQGVEVRLTGDAARAADVNCDGVVDLNDLTFLQDMIKEAEGAGQ